MLNRREFLGGCLVTAAAAYALPGDKMRFSYSGHQFRRLKPHPETGIKMTAQYGYHGLEPFEDDMPQYLKQPPEVFKKLLDDAGIQLATIGSSGSYGDSSKLKDIIANNVERSRYVSHFGCKVLKVNVGRRMGNPAEDMTTADAKTFARNITEVGKATLGEVGIKLAFHPHAWSAVERQSEFDKVMEYSDPKYVFVTLDTGHASLGGISPTRVLREHYERVVHVHFKDCPPQYNADKGWKGPAPSQEEHNRVNLYKRMGAGGVDFPAIMQILRSRGYDGWITMDFDAPRPNEGSVELEMDHNKKYLTEKLKVTLRNNYFANAVS
jgi:sugar phosphate isomerase/epimerase